VNGSGTGVGQSDPLQQNNEYDRVAQAARAFGGRWAPDTRGFITQAKAGG